MQELHRKSVRCLYRVQCIGWFGRGRGCTGSAKVTHEECQMCAVCAVCWRFRGWTGSAGVCMEGVRRGGIHRRRAAGGSQVCWRCQVRLSTSLSTVLHFFDKAKVLYKNDTFLGRSSLCGLQCVVCLLFVQTVKDFCTSTSLLAGNQRSPCTILLRLTCLINNKSKTRMTSSILRQDPNTYKIKKNAIMTVHNFYSV